MKILSPWHTHKTLIFMGGFFDSIIDSIIKYTMHLYTIPTLVQTLYHFVLDITIGLTIGRKLKDFNGFSN